MIARWLYLFQFVMLGEDGFSSSMEQHIHMASGASNAAAAVATTTKIIIIVVVVVVVIFSLILYLGCLPMYISAGSPCYTGDKFYYHRSCSIMRATGLECLIICKWDRSCRCSFGCSRCLSLLVPRARWLQQGKPKRCAIIRFDNRARQRWRHHTLSSRTLDEKSTWVFGSQPIYGFNRHSDAAKEQNERMREKERERGKARKGEKHFFLFQL